MVKDTFYTYALRHGEPKNKQSATIDRDELCLVLEDILNDSLSEAEAVNEDAKRLRQMKHGIKNMIRTEVAPIVLRKMDNDDSGSLDFSEFCEGMLDCCISFRTTRWDQQSNAVLLSGLDTMIKLIAHPARSTLTLAEELHEEGVDVTADGRIEAHAIVSPLSFVS